MKFIVKFYRAEVPPGLIEAEPVIKHEWRWSMKCRGLIVGESSRGFVQRGDALRNFSTVTGFAAEVPAGAPAEFAFECKR